MKYANLTRAGEIASTLPELERARTLLSNANATVTVKLDGEEATIPRELNLNLAASVNYEINRLRKEIETL